MGGGLALAAVAQLALSQQQGLRHSRNVFAIQGSAYGKLLARLAETTIDRVWHLGVEQIVPHYMSGEDHDHDHDHHHGHGHDHDHPHCHDHPHGHGHDHDHPELAHHEHGHAADAPHTGHSHEAADVPAAALAPDGSLLQRGKKWIQARVVGQYTRTNGRALSKAHLATVYRDIEKMLLRSFKYDPTHYGAYDSYHLFLTISEFGGTPMANEQARRVALAAIAAAQNETEDPEPWLTAATAGMNLFLMDSAPYTINNQPIPLDMLKHYRKEIGHSLQRFTEIQAQSERLGNWQRLSTERQMEISERARFCKGTFAQFDALIARAEQRLQSEPAEAEVAEVKEAP